MGTFVVVVMNLMQPDVHLTTQLWVYELVCFKHIIFQLLKKWLNIKPRIVCSLTGNGLPWYFWHFREYKSKDSELLNGI